MVGESNLIIDRDMVECAEVPGDYGEQEMLRTIEYLKTRFETVDLGHVKFLLEK